ncbi:hypothetical protein L6452_42644 [Arctium lappa]|uniref:Uncharacterized protein n=1 Tax=Arctium lappa TaxID=4217 RepID=A0ACB8XJL3_ARCLA|nr:hypothetical protein L6452_42644 [Arctium lappa]
MPDHSDSVVLSSIPRSASHCWRAIHAQLDFVDNPPRPHISVKEAFIDPNLMDEILTLIVNPSRISLFKESWLHPFGPSSRLILTSQYPKLSLSSSILSLGGLILFAPSILFYVILLL